MGHHLLNAHEAAGVLKMDSRTLIRWARLGHVPAHPMGEGRRKLWRFLEHELLDWIEARKAEKKGPLARRYRHIHFAAAEIAAEVEVWRQVDMN